MKYIVMEIQSNEDGTVGTLVDNFDEFNLAEQKYHMVLAYAAVSSVWTHSCVMLTDDGRFLKGDTYDHRPIEEPEAE